MSRATSTGSAMHREGPRAEAPRRFLPVVATSALAAALWLTFSAAPAVAQQGTITGRVTAEATGGPLAGAQVAISALNVGSLSQPNGRFLIVSVPAGTHTVSVTLIGYGTLSREVTVRADEATEVDFSLASAAINLDEIVVTGTGAPQQRRRLGQTITSVSAGDLEVAPMTSVADALVGRIAGAHGLMSGGETGAGAHIVLRGTGSMTQRMSPVIYIDGVRINNELETSESVLTDRLSDINPQDIERIEVIKGAAAATLFGTEASSGVIQIFTKRGQSGAPQYSFSVDQQYLEFPRAFPDNCAYDPSNKQLVCQNPYDEVSETGYHQNYNLSVRGGSERVRYAVSGRLMSENNPSPNNGVSLGSLRAGFDFTHTDRLTSRVDASIVQRNLQTASPGWGDAFGNLMLGNPLNETESNPYGAYSPFMVSLLTENHQNSYNILLSGQVAYEWADGLRTTLQVGHNVIDTRFSHFFPQGLVAEEVTGEKEVQTSRLTTTTVDFSTHWERQLSDRLLGNLTFGGQSFWETENSEFGGVRTFGSPTLKTLSGGEEITALTESFEEVINAGLFVQGQIGLDDRIFLTAGVRSDGNSAFGEDFGMEIYPKAGLSWVVSEHDFFDVGFVDELRLRAAMGSAGLQPGAFDAQQTWSPSSAVLGGYLTPGNVGNPDLRPERSTEYELALEAGLFGGRFGAELVYFNQRTENALLHVPNAPSSGFTGAQLENAGELRSWGIELTTNTRVIERSGFSFDLGLNPTWLNVEVTDLGDMGTRRISTRRIWNSLAEGHWPGVWISPVKDPDQPYILSAPIEQLTDIGQIVPNALKAADGSDSLVVVGNPHPNWTIDGHTTFQIGDRLTIRNVLSAAGGFVVMNETDQLRNAVGISPLAARLAQVLDDPSSTAEERFPLVDEYGRKHHTLTSNNVFAGDYLRWSEASVSYWLPESWTAVLGGASTTVSLAARNLYIFSGYFDEWKKGVMDPDGVGTHALRNSPECRAGGGGSACVFQSNRDFLKTPPMRRWVLSLRMQF